MRLDKFISSQNFVTRNESKIIIKNENILINGKLIKDIGFIVNPHSDRITINNNIIIYKEFIYIALNKPIGYVSATKDNLYQTVMDIIPKYNGVHLHIVGRLDKDTSGLIILTNNGEWSHKLKSPKSNIEKEYEVSLKKPLTDLMIKKINSELFLDGKKLKPIKINKINNNKCNITLTEGKYHQIKRIFKLIGNEVIKLNRIKIGEFYLEKFNILPGESKEFSI